MKRPVEHEYTSQVAYTRALEAYCDSLERLKQAQKQEPVFITHAVENAYDWSEWVCPDPKGYLMKCCDCGLVHEAQFKVVRYRSESEREDCDPVDDPNVQAVFRMRRSEQWSSEDMAYRAGGLPIEQAQKQEPVAWINWSALTGKRRLGWECESELASEPLYTSPPPRQPLTLEQLRKHWQVAKVLDMTDAEIDFADYVLIARDVEALYGIKGEA